MKEATTSVPAPTRSAPPLAAELPFAPGTSPFRAKGLVHQGARDYFAKRVPGSLAALRERLETEALRNFFDQRFLAASWFDVLPLLPQSVAAARLCGLTHHQITREAAAWLAERDLHGVYRFLLRLASIELVALRLPSLSMRYFDFGDADGRMIGASTMESSRRGIPEVMAPWFIACVDGFTPVALKLAGARAVRVAHDPPEPAGTVASSPTVTIRFTIDWD